MKILDLQKRHAISTVAVAVIVIVLVVAAGAAYYYVSTTTSGTSTPTTASTTPTSSTTSTSAAVPLSITFANNPKSDPATGSDEASSASFVNLYDTLVFPAATGSLQNDLATNWQASADGLTYTFTIRSGVHFHNGDTLTAKDVAFSMNRLITMGQGYSYLFSPYVSSTTAPDNSTVVFSLKKTFGPFLSALVRLYVLDQKQVVANEVSTSGQQFGSNLDYGSTWLLTHDAGSGPYVMSNVVPTASMTFQEFTGYWNGTRPSQPATVQIIGSSASTQALFSSHQIQITDQWQPYSTVASLAQLKGAQLVTIPTVNEMYLMVNTKTAPTDDIHVREAMSYALNYSAVVNNIFQGSKVSAGPVPTALPGHDSTIPAAHQDVTLAKQLISQSKYAGNLSSYSVKYWWVAEVPAEEKMALQFAHDMQQIGVTVQVVKTPWLSVVAHLANQSSSPNIVSIEDGASYFEAGSVLQSRYTSAADGTWEQNEWLQNTTLDSLISKALSTQDQSARFAAYAQVQHQIYNQFPTIYAFDVYEPRAYYPSVVTWYAANGHPIALLGYDFFFRSFQFFPDKIATLGS